MSALMKWYYLVQCAFWLQQIVVIHIEKHRKDYWQMLTHHVITCALLFTSYSFYMTRVGNAILCLMDVADIILSVGHMSILCEPPCLGTNDRRVPKSSDT